MNVQKAYEITDAKIQFVSLVDKAANLKTFLITKAKDGQATFKTCGRIVKTDTENHFVTGIVYEPMTEDAHGNYMTEDEITKAAYYFAKSGNKVDLQHSFEPLEKAAVVESWIAKADFQIGEETVSKGTWLMTVEIDDPDIWSKVEKGEITGFSMGGVGVYSKEDTDLENVEKNVGTDNEPEKNEKKSIFKRLAQLLGFDVVEKGALAEEYKTRQRSNNFWTAFYALEDILCHYDSWSGTNVFETDEEKVRDALSDFSTILQDVLLSGSPVTKAIGNPSESVLKAGKKISSANRAKLQGAYDQLGELLAEFADPDPEDETKGEEGKNKDSQETDDKAKEETEVTKAEVEQIVQDSVAAAIEKALGDNQPKEPDNQTAGGDAVTAEMVQEMVTKAVAEAVAPVLKARGVPTAIDGGTEPEPVVKQHYLHGIL